MVCFPGSRNSASHKVPVIPCTKVMKDTNHHHCGFFLYHARGFIVERLGGCGDVANGDHAVAGGRKQCL